MATLTIRNVPEATHLRLRERAARNGRSVESEVRGILDDAVEAPAHNFLMELHRQAVLRIEVDAETFVPSARDDMPRLVELP